MARKDLVCGMTVPDDSPLTYHHDGVEYAFCCEGCREKFRAGPGAFLASAGNVSSAYTDPVCGMSVAPDTKLTYTHDGVTYGFCCDGCRQKFAGDPSPYLQPVAEQPEPVAEADRYICPMCPGVESDRPGPCPVCGMALEPATPAFGKEQGANPELADMRRRFWFAVGFTVPLFLLSMGRMVPGWPVPHGAWVKWTELSLATPVILWAGFPFLVRAWRSVITRHFNMFTLIGLGVLVAYGFSIVAVLMPGVFPPSFRTPAGEVGVYFEAAAVIVTLVLLGQVLELRARERTGDAIRSLLSLAPSSAIRVDPVTGEDSAVELYAVRVGDLLRVRPGRRVPVDGTVTEGESAVDESMMSGEPIPVEKGPGAQVLGGSINGNGSLVITADRVGSESFLARMVALVSQAQRSRAPVQRVVDAVAGYFVPAVVAVSVVTFAVWAAVGPEPRLAFALVNAVAVLIIACPCALGLATPMSIMVASGRGAGSGVLFRDAEAIETLHRVDTVVIDKTGTLTEGRPTLTAVAAIQLSEDELVGLVASVERHSQHPIAEAMTRGAAARGIPLIDVTAFRSTPGGGVEAVVDGRTVRVGSEAFVAESPEAHRQLITNSRARGDTVMFAAVNGRFAGTLVVADPVRPTAAEAVRTLQADGLEIVMLTGDNEVTARAVAGELGIERVVAGTNPEGKLAEVGRLRAEGRVVAMAGDGVNDAPALAAADVGLAMGTGTDVAVESAAVTLVSGDLMGLVRARRLSAAAMRNIWQNLFFAFIYNGVGVPVAAGVLYPFFGVLLSPMIAAAAMSFSSVSVIGNALRLRHVRL